MTNDTWVPPLAQIPLYNDKFSLVDLIDSDLDAFNWYADSHGYARTNTTKNGKAIVLRLHRVIMERVLNRPLDRSELVDHIDHNPLNNSRSNLRIATRSQNQQNRRLNINSTSGYKGVSWHKTKKKWTAVINIEGKNTTLGAYKTSIEAAKAYNVAALKYFGEFAYINPIPD